MKSTFVAYLLLAVGLVGFCGLHRFYTGNFKTGLLWLLTLGLLGIGQIIDIFLVPSLVATGQSRGPGPRSGNAPGADPAGFRALPVSRAIMFQGTGSDVGKSLVVAGLARALANRGLKVAPFKPQNMSNNAAVTDDGGEIGRAQALQARAARMATTAHMNPVLFEAAKRDRRSRSSCRAGYRGAPGPPITKRSSPP